MRIRIFVLVGLVAGFFVSSCDKLEAPYATAKEITVDTTKRTVLLEDYTGMKCVNCPAAAVSAEALVELYKGQVIVMAVHAGYFSKPDPTGNYTADYRTTEGVAWFNDFQLISNPMGMVNRTPFNGKIPIGAGSWAEAVSAAVKEDKVTSISIHTELSGTLRGQLSTTIDTKFLTPLTGAYSLTVCILEDSIIGWQKNNDTAVGPIPDIEKYVFNNMLRAVINGTYGEQLTTDVDTGQTYTKNYVFTLNDSWVPDHLSVLAFVSNTDSLGIIQVERKELTE